MNKVYDYDAIIIGAGISGLVCGCYLAKAGLKTLIVEKNANVGGYATSFKNKGFYFDTFAHSFGSCRPEGNLTKIFEELNLKNNISINRADPSDIIITPDCKVSFYSDLNKTIREFQDNFPLEKESIRSFFESIINEDISFLVTLRNRTFQDILDQFFINKQIKSILGFTILGNTGMPPSLIGAFSAYKLYREFMLDGGYYIKEGMKQLSQALAIKYKELGGKLILSNKIKKVILKNNIIDRVQLHNNDSYSAKNVISNADATQTYFNLIGKENLENEFSEVIEKMKPSLSMFVLYLGVKNSFSIPFGEGTNIWYLPIYDIEEMYNSASTRSVDNISEFMFHKFSDKAIAVYINANFVKGRFWDQQKDKISEKLIDRVTKIIPNLKENIVFQNCSTPQTLYKMTLNHEGAAYGWKIESSNSWLRDFPKRLLL